MPRIRPIQNKETETALTPEIAPDKSVTITLTDDDKVKFEAADDVKTEAKAQEETQTEVKVEAKSDDGLEDLKEQLRLAREAQETAQKQAVEYQRLKEEAERRAKERETEAIRFRSEAEQSAYNEITSGIMMAQSESDSASRDYVTAQSNQDWQTAAEAQRRIARAETRLAQLEDGKAALEARREQQNAQAQAPQADSFESAIAGYPQKAQVWLRNNRDFATNPANNAKIQAAHWGIVNEGVQAYSDDYFSRFEERVGLKTPVKKQEPGEKVVSAPPSRSSSGVNFNGRTITLSPAQREAARISGISEVEYGKQLLRMELEKNA